MEPVTAAISLVGFSLAKRLGKEAISSAFLSEATRDTLDDVLTDAADKLVEPLEKLLDSLKVSRNVRNAISRDPTIFDLAGIAWSQALNEMDEGNLGAFNRPAPVIRRTLSPRWFRDALLSAPDLGLGFDLGRTDPRQELPQEFRNNLTSHLSASALDEFAIDGSPDIVITNLIHTIVAELPRRIESIFLSLPGVNDTLARVAAEAARDTAKRIEAVAENTHQLTTRIANIVDGTESSRSGYNAASQISNHNILRLQHDVFGRQSALSEEFPLLPLENTYVEPSSSSDNLNDAPVLSSIRTALETSNGLVVLLAPFGFGKSLTVRVISALLSKE